MKLMRVSPFIKGRHISNKTYLSIKEYPRKKKNVTTAFRYAKHVLSYTNLCLSHKE